MAVDRCGVTKDCKNPGTNERLVAIATTEGRRRELVFRLPVCNDHLVAVRDGMKFEGFIALGDDAVSADG